jgi:hypothetical protein
MSRFLNTETKVVISVADDKDDRFASPLWEAAPAEAKSSRRTAKSEDK